MEYLTKQEKMACMAGTAISKKQNNKISKTANLNITLHSTPASICCCLWLQQPQVVESNNNKCNTNDRPMKENSNHYCHNSSSCCTTDDSISTNYNYNLERTVKQQKQQKQRPSKQCPLTLSVAVIIMSLTIFLIQMPTMAMAKSIYVESVSASEDMASASAETSAELESKLLLSLLAEAQQATEQDAASVLDESSASASLDQLTAVEVLRHIQRTQQHQRERRMRLRKRHARDLLIVKYLDDTNGQNLEWKNPCNVDHVDMAAETRPVTKQQMYQYLKKFERDVLIQYEYINTTANTISISDMAQWDLHEDMYKFLPKLKANGNIALSRWYRNMQVYVASFGHLARLQYKFDMKKRMFAGDTSEELNKLLKSARFMLCELETTINGSAPNNNLKKLKTISRRAMNDRLNFESRHHQANGHVLEPSSKDLKFAKSSYFQFLSNMQKILNHKLQNKGRKYGIVDSSEDNFSNTIIVGDDTSSLDSNFINRSDVSLSVAESIEILFKPTTTTTTKKPATHRRRTHKKKSAKLPEA